MLNLGTKVKVAEAINLGKFSREKRKEKEEQIFERTVESLKSVNKHKSGVWRNTVKGGPQLNPHGSWHPFKSLRYKIKPLSLNSSHASNSRNIFVPFSLESSFHNSKAVSRRDQCQTGP